MRNSKVVDLIRELEEFGFLVLVIDRLADAQEVNHEYGLRLCTRSATEAVDVLILAVPHATYLSEGLAGLTKSLRTRGLIVDIKSVLDPAAVDRAGFQLWRL